MGQLDGKVAIITGAARGMGEAQVRLFVANGAKVVMTDILEAGAKVAAELGDAVVFVQHDVSNAAQWAKVLETALSRFGRLDILVNNGAVNISKPMLETTVEDVEKCFRVNAIGTMLGMQTCFKALKESGKGAIVNIVSAAGMHWTPNIFSYATSKWAARGMSGCAAAELGRHGIRVNSIHPGMIKTDMLMGSNPPEVIQRGEARVPLGRIGDVVEVAKVSMFLASDDASYLNGSEVVVDGGITL